MVSIIIPTAQFGGQYLQKLLPIVCAENQELIVVDNASLDNTEQICKDFPIQYIKNATNENFARACNKGAKTAKGDYLIFLNNDTYPSTGFVQKMLDIFNTPKYSQGAEMGILGVQLVFYANGELQHGGIGFDLNGYAYEIRDKAHNKEREMNAVTAACMMIRKDVFNRVGGFDERYINGWEDVDLCLKVRELGYRIVYTDRVIVRHVHMGTKGRTNNDEYNKSVYKSKWLDTGKLKKIL